MAFSYGFYNAVNHDRRYDAVQFGQIFDGIIADGVYATYKKALVVIASSEVSQVIVQPGRAWFNHTWSYNDANLPIAAPDPEVILDRIDALVLDINSELETRENKFTWVQGTPTSQNPQRPTLEHTDTHNQYALCYVYRHGDKYEILQEDITNVIGTSETPFVTGIIDTVNIDELLLQWTAEFRTFMNTKHSEMDAFQTQEEQEFFAWMEGEKSDWADFIEHNYTAWSNWFQHLQDELDDNQAAHLQAQIDHFSYMYVIDNVLYLPNTAASVADGKLILTNYSGSQGG